jgi:glyoxylase-like metal-dependent hydrolase (beta-lactamase superfamily II)
LASHRDELIAPLAAYLTPDLIDIAGRLEPLADGRLPWAGPTAECIEHDAHSPAHLALFLPDSGVLVAGDMLGDLELPMPEDDESLEHYSAGLAALHDAVRAARWLIPGHGTVTTDARARYDADMRYLDDLLAGRPSHDPRISDPQNAALHRDNVLRAKHLPSTVTEV